MVNFPDFLETFTNVNKLFFQIQLYKREYEDMWLEFHIQVSY